jgi:hypothetical protein
MSKPRLHLDADVSIKSLYDELKKRNHDVTRTPTDWISMDASDEAQLLGSTAQGRIILTFNIRDFITLAKRFPYHGGIVLAAQSRWTLPALITALDGMLTESQAEPWIGQIRWLNDWR